MDEVFDVMIIGAGAAGLTAGIYTSRAKLSTIILNEGAIGGQMPECTLAIRFFMVLR